MIYNDNVAIIELIKNSKDASSDKVILSFNDIIEIDDLIADSNTKPKIIIKDFGMGMSRLDIEEKWLNIAYSEKKNRTDQVYAGNKGVGRFSCDRLGRNLELYTKSKEDKYLRIKIDWTLFENKGINDLISSIPLEIEVLDKDFFLECIGEKEFISGTVLIINELRSQWNEQKIKKLLAEIEKFSPSLDDSFEVYFKSNMSFKDKFLCDKRINNNILDKLSFKTTRIKSNIDELGEYLYTELYYYNEKVYKYKAINPYPNLKNIVVEIHYLDTLSKSYFTKSFGIKPNLYGSVFLFYNQFRISPYGNEKNDWLGLDQRKAQGTSRNFGTRDLIGRIDVRDLNGAFSVITSREGLAHNNSYYDLIAYDQDDQVKLTNGKSDYGYVNRIIRQLESFVVNGLDWNRISDNLEKMQSVSGEEVIKNPDRFSINKLSEETIHKEVNKVLKSKYEIVDFDVNNELIGKINEINSDKFNKFISDFIVKTEDKTLLDLSKTEINIVKKIISESNKKVNVAKAEAITAKIKEKEAVNLVEKVEKKLLIEKKKHSYLLATRRTLSPDADGLIHTIKINNIEINEGIDSIIEGIQYNELTQEDIVKKLSAIKLYSMKSLKMAELATRSGFDKDIDIRTIDIVTYIVEYLNIYKDTIDNNLYIQFENNDIEFIRSLSVLNLSIVLDNLISNSVKWNADNVRISFEVVINELWVTISDNGLGLSELFTDSPEEIFNLGVRDEAPEGVDGSGIGLHYSRSLLSKANASIDFLGNNIHLKGASFKVVFR
nr:ATP-binding protein [Photobacterium phosphoreum]